MGMKETAGSLRAYFIIAGVIAAGWGLKELSDVSKLDLSMLPAFPLVALYVPLITRLLLGVAFVLAGAGFKADRPKITTFTKQLLVLAGVMLFVDGALITAAFGTEIGQSGITGALVGLLIVIYLYRSVVRLAAEAVPHAPPEAKAL